MSMELCQLCRNEFDEDDLVDGTCPLCMECFDPNPKPLDFDNMYELIDKTGDCV